MQATNTSYIVENPRSSMLWDYEPIRVALIKTNGQKHLIHYCAYGAPWMKPTFLASNLPCVATLSKACHGGYICSYSGRPHIQLRGRRADGTWRTSFAQPDPQFLCLAVARMVRNFLYVDLQHVCQVLRV